jgi:hypothetical protein
MLNYLHFKTIYSRRRKLDALFLIKLSENKSNCCSIMDTVGHRVPTKQITDFSTFNVSTVSRFSPSTRCVTTADRISKSLDVFNEDNISREDTYFSLFNPSELRHYCASALFYYLLLIFSLVLLLVSVLLLLCTISVLACYRPFAVGKHLNKEIGLNYYYYYYYYINCLILYFIVVSFFIRLLTL